MAATLAVGFGGFGGLALDTYKTQNTLVESSDLSALDIQSISVGLWHSLIVTTNGHLYGVGRNRYGALGLGEPESLDVLNYTLPIQVTEPFSTSAHHRVLKASAGKTHSLVLTADGTLFSFGFGMGCGHGMSSLCGIPEPIQYLFSYRIVDCSAGEGHSAAVSEDGKLFSWGLENRHKPVMVRNKLIDAEVCSSVSCGTHHGFVLTENGKLFGYGRNVDGQVSKDSDSNHISEESLVEVKHPQAEYGSRWVQVSCGMRQTMALDNMGNVYLWGRLKTSKTEKNDHLSDANSQIMSPTMVNIPITKGNVKKIACSYSSFFVLTNDGTVYSWGHNLHYNLGHGHGKYVNDPTPISSITETYIGDFFVGGYNMFLMTGVSFTSSYEKLLKETQYYADFILKSKNGDQSICHAAILSARSPYLASLLIKDFLESSSNNNEYSKDSKFKITDPSHIERVITLDFVENQQELDEILNFIYKNTTGRSKKSEKMLQIINDYIHNTKESVKILQILTQKENLSDENKKDLTTMIDIINNQMTHTPVKISSTLMGELSEYTRDFENLYKLSMKESSEHDAADANTIFSFLSDVSFSLDDGTFIRSHRCILCARLEYFRAMFSIGQFSESFQKVIHLDNTNRDSFEILLKHIYTGNTQESELTAEQSVPLLELATRFSIDNLKLAAERKIVLYLQPSNVLQMCQVAEMCQAEIVKKCCIHLIARNFNLYTAEQLEAELDANLIENITNVHHEFTLARAKQEDNERQVFQYMKEQKDAFDSLLEDGERQHLVDQYDEEDVEVIKSILGGNHNPNAPVHANVNRHHNQTTTRSNNNGSSSGRRMNNSSERNCLVM